jgi:hypothetical protein
MGVCYRDPIQIRHAKDLPTARVARNLHARCSAQHDATDLESGHSELRNDFELWKLVRGLVSVRATNPGTAPQPDPDPWPSAA